jgi:hypothetical protein
MNNHELHVEKMNMLYAAWELPNPAELLERLHDGTIRLSAYTPRLQVVRKIFADLKNARKKENYEN